MIATIVVTSFLQMVVKSVPYWSVVVAWLCAVFFVILTLIMTDSKNSSLVPVYALSFGILIYEYERQRLSAFITIRQKKSMALNINRF